MKTKLSPIEELKAEYLRLNIEKDGMEARLKDKFSYLSDHFGSMLVSTILPSPKNISRSLTGFIVPNSRNKTGIEKIKSYLPFIWDIAQPILIGIFTKKLTSRIFGRKRKKK